MKKIKVIVKEKTILELVEDANKGDLIDLKELVQVDTSYIDSVIEAGKDKVYQSKLEDVKKALTAENMVEINRLKGELERLKIQSEKDIKLKENEVSNKYNEKVIKLEGDIKGLNSELENKIKIKEQEIDKKYMDQVNELQRQIEVLTKNRYTELEAISNKNRLEIANVKEEENKKYQELENKYNVLLAQLESSVKERTLEVEKEYINQINDLKNEIIVNSEKQKQEVEKIKSDLALELEKTLNNQKEKFIEELRNKEEVINNLQRQKANMNVKQIGEDLEAWCNNEVNSYMQNGLFNCTWIKDTKAVKNEDDEKKTKADYIFKIYASESHKENELLAAVCLEMKDENPDSKTKQTNEHYYKRLDENRNKKGCKYAVLVSNLENDKPNILPIYKVREYENMYVVRPAYMMVFLNMITSLTTRFSDLLLSKEQEMVELKSRLDIIEEFNKIKESYLDNPLTSLEKQVNSITKSSESIKKAAADIDTACEAINEKYIKKINDKISTFEVKLNKKVIKKID